MRKARRGRPLCLLDIAVPRDVEPEAGELDGIYLFDIDDLQKQASEHRAEREEEAAEAEAVVEEELGRFVKRWRSRQLGPMVSALQTHFHGIAQRRGAAGVGRRRREGAEGAPRPGREPASRSCCTCRMIALRDDDPDEAVSLVQARAATVRAVAGGGGARAPKRRRARRERSVDKKATGS